MNLRRWSPALAAGAALLILFVGGGADLLPGGVRGLLVGIALLQIPGFLLARTLGLRVTPTEAPALFFSLSIALALPALLVAPLTGASLATMLPILAGTLVAAAFAASLRSAPALETDEPRSGEVRTLVAIACALGALLTLAAWALTETGAVDRWWYLAYIRSYATAETLELSEPFFGSDFVHPRFSINAWLLMLATWSRLAAIDPVFLYERVAPLIAVPAALSAARLLAGSIFTAPRTIWLAVIATALLWSGGSLFPIVTRSIEDKFLAALVLAPVSIAVIARALSTRSTAWVVAAALTLAAQCTVHPVVYMLTALTALPYIALMGASRRTGAAVAFALALLIAIGAAYPMSNGSESRALLEADGATLEQTDHPVVRIHRSRDRLIEFDSGGYVVNPALLAHPLTGFALLSLFFLGARSREERFFLIPATLLPLFICFVPPLTSLAGTMAVPWMIYRTLWAIPYGLLAASGMEAAASAFRIPTTATLALLAIGIVPIVQSSIVDRFAPAGVREAMPEGEFTDVVTALGTLEMGSIVAAAPELSERLPAVAGTNVLAMSDRATVVFSGSREAAKGRLRANAMIAAGLWRTDNVTPTPTHILLEPGSITEKYCGAELYKGEQFALCTFEPAKSKPGVNLASTEDQPDPKKSETHSYPKLIAGAAKPLSMKCTPPAATRNNKLVWGRPGPWSARYPGLFCRLTVGRDERVGRMIAERLRLRAFVGSAIDEYIVEVRAFDDLGQRWSLRNRTEVVGLADMAFRLPRSHAHTFEVTVVPTYLPFIKLDTLELTFAKGMVTSTGGIALDKPLE